MNHVVKLCGLKEWDAVSCEMLLNDDIELNAPLISCFVCLLC